MRWQERLPFVGSVVLGATWLAPLSGPWAAVGALRHHEQSFPIEGAGPAFSAFALVP